MRKSTSPKSAPAKSTIVAGTKLVSRRTIANLMHVFARQDINKGRLLTVKGYLNPATEGGLNKEAHARFKALGLTEVLAAAKADRARATSVSI